MALVPLIAFEWKICQKLLISISAILNIITLGDKAQCRLWLIVFPSFQVLPEFPSSFRVLPEPPSSFALYRLTDIPRRCCAAVEPVFLWLWFFEVSRFVCPVDCPHCLSYIAKTRYGVIFSCKHIEVVSSFVVVESEAFCYLAYQSV